MSQFDKIIDRTNTNAIKCEPRVLKEMFKSEDLLPLWVADMDFKCPEPVIKALLKRAEHGIYGYSDMDDAFFDTFIDWNLRRNKWKIERDWLVFTPGVVPAVNYIIQAFCQTGDKVIIQNPVYYPFSNAIKNNGAQILLNPLVYDGVSYKMDFDDLEEKVKDPRVKVFILCNPHNPVGRVWTVEELTRLGEICIKHHVLVISDEIHSDLILKGNHHVPFARISETFANNSITCMAPSKTFNLAGLQISNIIIPNEAIRNDYKARLENNAIMRPNAFGIVAQKAAYGESEAWLEEVIAYIEGNMDFIDTFVKEKLPEITFVKPEGTYLAWLDFRKLGMDKLALEALMQSEAKLALDEGYIFGEGGEGFERINVACPRAILEEALNRIEKVLRKKS